MIKIYTLKNLPKIAYTNGVGLLKLRFLKNDTSSWSQRISGSKLSKFLKKKISL